MNWALLVARHTLEKFNEEFPLNQVPWETLEETMVRYLNYGDVHQRGDESALTARESFTSFVERLPDELVRRIWPIGWNIEGG